jgi:DNA processing protein
VVKVMNVVKATDATNAASATQPGDSSPTEKAPEVPGPVSPAIFVAFSLLPLWLWLRAPEQLRDGRPPSDVLEELLSKHYSGEPAMGAALRARAAAALDRAYEKSLAPVCWGDASYPVALAATVDPPPLLWVQGSIAALHASIVAIVGARAATSYALATAKRIAGDLASAGLVIASGMARGVDSAAHLGALESSGQTIAVLGSGVDVVYPAEHAALACRIAASGAVVSELAPGTPPRRMFFPRRNRIISGLSRAVVVVEAGERSGSLITARLALEQGRSVLAVPGSVLTGRNRGAHGLLRAGAKIVESADDILEELATGGTHFGKGHGRKRRPASASEDRILACLRPGQPSDLQEISERSGLNPSRLLPRLFQLELRGAIVRVAGRFVLS